MSLTLKIVGDRRRSLGARADKTFGQAGGTIGRSLEADWSLPDGQRFMSNMHASIDFRSGCYYIVDTSKNGVFVNDADEPVGRGKPQRLFSGDMIRLGEYTIQVTIANVDDTRETLLDNGHVDPVDRKQRVDAPEPTSCELIAAETITGVGIEMFVEDEDAETLKPVPDKRRTGDSSVRLSLVEDTPAPAKPAAAPSLQSSSPKQASAPTPAAARTETAVSAARLAGGAAPKPAAPRPPAPATAAPKPAASKPAAATAAPSAPRPAAPTPFRSNATPKPADPAAARSALEAFFRGAGIDPPALDARQTEQFMTELGMVTRELIAGVIDGLHGRALQKAQLKQSNTTIQKLDNNRIKFAANVEEGFAKLFGEASEQYMSPVESVRTAFADLKHHQRALLAATRSAIDAYLERLNPDQIENRAGTGLGSALINAANKFKYWDLYKDVYGILANRTAEEMPQAFLDELSNAYADEIARNAPRSEPAAVDKEAG